MNRQETSKPRGPSSFARRGTGVAATLPSGGLALPLPLDLPEMGAGLPKMDEQTFLSFCRIIYDKAGIKLGRHKEALLCARIGKRMRVLGIKGFAEYHDRVEEDESGVELVELLNVVSTNVTSFFREERHFALLGDIVRRWEQAGQTKFRIWCAAASTGEEPYSVAITLRANLRDSRDTLVLATDLSTRVLEAARKGIYEERHMEKVPSAILQHYFNRRNGGDTVHYAVCDEVRRMLRFGRVNLAHPPFPMKGPLDVIFCRNVMIYFDDQVRRRLLEELYRLVRPGGYLMVGHAESLSGMLSRFKAVEPSVYRKD